MKVSNAERCPTCRRRHTRSTEANRRYWLILHALSEKLKPGGVRYSADQFHLYCKSRFLGCDDVSLPNGKTITIPRSTAALDVAEFNIYMERVEHWAGERDVWLDEIASTA